jgi:hypothetical protein
MHGPSFTDIFFADTNHGRRFNPGSFLAAASLLVLVAGCSKSPIPTNAAASNAAEPPTLASTDPLILRARELFKLT